MNHDGNPEVTFVESAFTRSRGPDPSPDPARTGFSEYFSYESLFTAPTTIAEPLLGHPGTDPCRVLGVAPDATWREIVKAHRNLVKLHHPDRLLDADDEERAEAAERLHEINEAYRELQRSQRERDAAVTPPT